MDDLHRPRIKPSLSAWFSHATPALWVLLLGLAIRAVALAVRWDRLLSDPDSYWQYARAIWFDGTYLGSAYRPPGYPVILALAYAAGEGGRQFGVAALHLILAGLAIIATMACARRLGFGGAAAITAGLFVAVDPLAIYWVTEVMSETTATALVAVSALLVLFATQSTRPAARVARWLLVGVVSATALLTRPDVGLGVAVLAAVALGVFGGSTRGRGTACAAFCAGLALVWGPWVARNYALSGEWVPLTTHGGYTAVLGNNSLWYDVVRQRGLLATYRGAELRELQASLLRGFRASGLEPARSESKLVREVAFDRYCYRVAIAAARSDRPGFLRAACHRLIALWRPVPARPLPAAARWLLAAWYVFVFAAAAAALGRAALERKLLPVAPLVLLALTLSAVHIVYWSEMRMRTPLAPAFAIAVAFLCDRGCRGIVGTACCPSEKQWQERG